MSPYQSICVAVSFIKRKLFSYQLTTFYFPSLCVCVCVYSAGTLSVCVNEKFVDPLLHTVALQFLRTIFTEETKRRGVEVTTSSCKHATALSDILNGPSASRLCELLLQVREGVEACGSLSLDLE